MTYAERCTERCFRGQRPTFRVLAAEDPADERIDRIGVHAWLEQSLGSVAGGRRLMVLVTLGRPLFRRQWFATIRLERRRVFVAPADELAVLDEYLPRQLGEEELRAAISTLVNDSGATSIGPIMKELSSRYPGRYDGKLASRIAQELVNK